MLWNDEWKGREIGGSHLDSFIYSYWDEDMDKLFLSFVNKVVQKRFLIMRAGRSCNQ